MSFQKAGARRFGAVATIAAAVFAAITGVASATEYTFQSPTIQHQVNGIPMLVRVDFCWRHQQQCGLRAADLFCDMKGFPTLKDFKKAPNLYVTVSVGDKKTCEGSKGQCDGFVSITCSKP